MLNYNIAVALMAIRLFLGWRKCRL